MLTGLRRWLYRMLWGQPFPICSACDIRGHNCVRLCDNYKKECGE